MFNRTLNVIPRAAVFGGLIAASSAALAYTWSVTLPADINSSITNCTVVMHDKTPNSGIKDISRGNSAAWSSATIAGVSSPLTYVSGRCQYSMAGRAYVMLLKGRTCNGADFTNTVDGTLSCPTDIRLKVCPNQTSSSLDDYSYGFCPN